MILDSDSVPWPVTKEAPSSSYMIWKCKQVGVGKRFHQARTKYCSNLQYMIRIDVNW